jgi:hypothetical protein
LPARFCSGFPPRHFHCPFAFRRRDYQPDVLDVALSAVISLILAVGIASIASIFKDRLAAEKSA